MTLHIKDGTVWKQASKLFVKDGTTWKEVLKAFVKDGATWKELYSNAGASIYWQGNIGPIYQPAMVPPFYRYTGNRTKTGGTATLSDYRLDGDGPPNYTEVEWMIFSGDLAGAPSSISVTFNGTTKAYARMDVGAYYNSGVPFSWPSWIGQTLPLIVTPI